MKFIAIEKELKSDGYTKEVLKSEAKTVWELSKQGIIREIYFKKAPKEAVIILECSDYHQAEKCLSELPLVKNGLIEFQISELIPYDGFDRLLEQ